MGFSRQEYWSWLPHPSPEDLSNLGMDPVSPWQVGREAFLVGVRDCFRDCGASEEEERRLPDKVVSEMVLEG